MGESRALWQVVGSPCTDLKDVEVTIQLDEEGATRGSRLN